MDSDLIATEFELLSAHIAATETITALADIRRQATELLNEPGAPGMG